jgi:hypothetical protein
MLRFAFAQVAIVAVAASLSVQSSGLRLDCNADEAVALRRAPLGAARVSKQRLTVRWRGGTRVFRDSGVVDGYLDGVSYQYCGYDPASGFHLIHKHANAIFGGVLLNHTNGRLLPAGQHVLFAPDTVRYFATVQPDGLDGEEWYVYSIRGVQVWKGLSGITAKHPSLKYDYFIATLEAPHWSARGELQATLTCTSGAHSVTTVTLRGKRGIYAWEPLVACPPPQ